MFPVCGASVRAAAAVFAVVRRVAWFPAPGGRAARVGGDARGGGRAAAVPVVRPRARLRPCAPPQAALRQVPRSRLVLPLLLT